MVLADLLKGRGKDVSHILDWAYDGSRVQPSGSVVLNNAIIGVRTEGLRPKCRVGDSPACGSAGGARPAELVLAEDDGICKTWLIWCISIGAGAYDGVVPLDKNVRRQLKPSVIAVDHQEELVIVLRTQRLKVIQDPLNFGKVLDVVVLIFK